MNLLTSTQDKVGKTNRIESWGLAGVIDGSRQGMNIGGGERYTENYKDTKGGAEI